MARFDVLIKPSAVKEIEAIASKKERRRVVIKIHRLADQPRPPGCRKLAVGVYRILYVIKDKQLIVFVVKVGHRKNVYH